jgi:hypothetical protein
MPALLTKVSRRHSEVQGDSIKEKGREAVKETDLSEAGQGSKRGGHL